MPDVTDTVDNVWKTAYVDMNTCTYVFSTTLFPFVVFPKGEGGAGADTVRMMSGTEGVDTVQYRAMASMHRSMVA